MDFIIILLIILVIIYTVNMNEYFIPIFNGYTNFPFNNTQVGTKTNMSYDIRGEPIIIPHQNFVWNNSEISPIHNEPL